MAPLLFRSTEFKELEIVVLCHELAVLPSVMPSDRLLCGVWPLFLNPTPIRKLAIAFRPSTLLAFHQALVRRKHRWLFSSKSCPKKPEPKGPDEALVRMIVELKSRNPRFGCPRIARIVSQTFRLDIDKNVVSRVCTAKCQFWNVSEDLAILVRFCRA